MKVVILCGGRGTRLLEQTEHIPKPMVSIGGHPIIWHIMKLYAHHGFKEFVLCLGYKGYTIKSYFLDFKERNNDFTIDMKNRQTRIFHRKCEEDDYVVTLKHTGRDNMTGSRIKQIESLIDDELFMVSYGDGLSNVDLSKVLEFHRSHGKLATVTAVRPVSRWGILDLDSDDTVRQFAEKPRTEGWVSAGFFVFNRKVFDYLKADVLCSLEEEPLKTLSREGQLAAYKHDGFFFGMDTYREYLHLKHLWDTGQAEWAVWLDKQ